LPNNKRSSEDDSDDAVVKGTDKGKGKEKVRKTKKHGSRRKEKSHGHSHEHGEACDHEHSVATSDAAGVTGRTDKSSVHDSDTDSDAPNPNWTAKIREKQASRVKRIVQGDYTSGSESSDMSDESDRATKLKKDAGGGSEEGKSKETKEKATARATRKSKPFAKVKPNRYEVGVE